MADQIFNIPLFIHFQYLTDLIYFGKPNLVFFIYFKSKISRHSKGVSVIVHTGGRKRLGDARLLASQSAVCLTVVLRRVGDYLTRHGKINWR